MSEPGLVVEDLVRDYPGTRALDGVSLTLPPGRVRALVGRNGAGKSTLVRVLSGALRPTSGRLALDGRPFAPRSPADAADNGVATVYQETSLVPGLSVAENIVLGRWPRRRRFGIPLVDRAEARARTRALLDDLRVAIDPDAPVARLDVAGRQTVEIAKALARGPRVLLLDEPTSALADRGAQALFALVRRLAGRGVVVVYVTHRLGELGDLADDVSVLRDGRLAGTVAAKDADPATLARMMFGEEIARGRPAPVPPAGPPVLEVRGLSTRSGVRDVSFTVRRGEVLGIAGTLGSGRTELVRAIFGADPFASGTIVVGGSTVIRPSPRAMQRLGVGLVPEDRKDQGLVMGLSIRDNLSLASLETISRYGLVRSRAETERTTRAVRDLGIDPPDASRPAGALSGGNQQKVVAGKWLVREPAVLLLDEPTRGIDIRAKAQLFALIRDLSRRGIAALVVSTEIEELLEVCHRILVMRFGRVVADLSAEGLTPETLLATCLGASAEAS